MATKQDANPSTIDGVRWRILPKDTDKRVIGIAVNSDCAGVLTDMLIDAGLDKGTDFIDYDFTTKHRHVLIEKSVILKLLRKGINLWVECARHEREDKDRIDKTRIYNNAYAKYGEDMTAEALLQIGYLTQSKQPADQHSQENEDDRLLREASNEAGIIQRAMQRNYSDEASLFPKPKKAKTKKPANDSAAPSSEIVVDRSSQNKQTLGK